MQVVNITVGFKSLFSVVVVAAVVSACLQIISRLPKRRNVHIQWPTLTSAHLCALLAENSSLSPHVLKKTIMCTIHAVRVSTEERNKRPERHIKVWRSEV